MKDRNHQTLAYELLNKWLQVYFGSRLIETSVVHVLFESVDKLIS